MGDSPPIGLIAGAGGLPAEACSRLRACDVEVCVFAFDGITDSFLPSEPLVRTRLGELVRLRDALRERSIARVLIVGKFDRALLAEAGGRLSPDAEALSLMQKILGQPDEPLMTAVADWLADQGFELARQDALLSDMLAKRGLVSRTPPTVLVQRDLEVGIAAVRELDPLGAAQAVAVKDGIVVAVESIGTDELIHRAGEIAGEGLSLVKGARRGQDRRLDLPAVGANTIDALASVKGAALSIEADSTLIVSAEAFLRKADEAGISVSSWTRRDGV